QKTPNEIALNTLLVGLTLIFMVVLISLYPMANYAGVKIPISTTNITGFFIIYLGFNFLKASIMEVLKISFVINFVFLVSI
ncbi:hypothetical protein EVX89_20050, partial [Clostridioides difficile]|uniref:hypothetical protein n=1 Tax=Clostridioides difficile TaxID=1496 RepID=UPI00115D4E5F